MLAEILAVVIVLLFLIIIAITILMAIGYKRGMAYWTRYQDIQFPKRMMSDVYPELKTGDILLFIASTHGFTNSMLSQEVFSHAGVVVEENGRLYLSESTQGVNIAPGIRSKNGSDIVPLLTRLSNYSGQIFVMPLESPLDEEICEKVRQVARVRRPYPGLSRLLAGVIFGEDDKSRHCFQHVGRILSDAGITRENAPLSETGYIGVCNAVIALPKMTLRRGMKYLEPFQVVYDVPATRAI